MNAYMICMARFRFRRGPVELEIEYPGEVPAEKETVVDSLLEHFESLLKGSEEPLVADGEPSAEKGEKRSKRGGARKAFVSPGIDELIGKKWLVEKTTGQIVAQLKADGIVGANEDNVSSALLRKVQSRALVRTQRDGEWVWTIPTL